MTRWVAAAAAAVLLYQGAANACPAPGASAEQLEKALQQAYKLDRQGEYKKAILGFQGALALDPGSRRAHYLLANAFWRDDQLAAARMEWETVLRMGPRDQLGLEARAWLRNHAGSMTGATVTTHAGGTSGFADGPGARARFNHPSAMLMTRTGSLYVADTGNRRLRQVTPEGHVVTLVGDGRGGFADGPDAVARIEAPTALALDPAGNLFFADNHRVRFRTPDGRVGTLAGDGSVGHTDGDWRTTRFDRPVALGCDTQGNVYVADAGGARLRLVTASGVTRTLAGAAAPGYADGPGEVARFGRISLIRQEASGDLLVVDAGANRLRRVSPDGHVKTLRGCATEGYVDGPVAQAHFRGVEGLAVGEDGAWYLADAGNHAIRRLSPQGLIQTVAGGAGAGPSDGTGILAAFTRPGDLALRGRELYVLDRGGSSIRKVLLPKTP